MSTNEELQEDGVISKNGRVYKGLQTSGDTDIRNNAKRFCTKIHFLSLFIIFLVISNEFNSFFKHNEMINIVSSTS